MVFLYYLLKCSNGVSTYWNCTYLNNFTVSEFMWDEQRIKIDLKYRKLRPQLIQPTGTEPDPLKKGTGIDELTNCAFLNKRKFTGADRIFNFRNDCAHENLNWIFNFGHKSRLTNLLQAK